MSEMRRERELQQAANEVVKNYELAESLAVTGDLTPQLLLRTAIKALKRALEPSNEQSRAGVPPTAAVDYRRRLRVPGDAIFEAEGLAQYFHETYEMLAPEFAYETRKASAKPWAEVPEQNKRLMIAVADRVLRRQLRALNPSEPCERT